MNGIQVFKKVKEKGGCAAFVFGCIVNINTDMYSLVTEANDQHHRQMNSISCVLSTPSIGVMISTTDLAKHSF
ncbi:hypothetical protein Bca4012_063871 [Brassica carinata]